MLRNSFKYVNYSDLKKFSSDFKAVYNAPNETSALSELEKIKEKWGRKYPYAVSNWENNTFLLLMPVRYISKVNRYSGNAGIFVHSSGIHFLYYKFE